MGLIGFGEVILDCLFSIVLEQVLIVMSLQRQRVPNGIGAAIENDLSANELRTLQLVGG